MIELLVPRALTREGQSILLRVRSGECWAGELFVRRKGGGAVRTSTHLWPLVDCDGSVSGVVGESEEVTAERLLDAELRARGESLLLGLQDGKLGSWHWDIATGAVTWDTSLEALHGLAPDGFGGTLDDWLALVHPDDTDATADALRSLRGPSETFQVEYRVGRPDGSGHRLLARGQSVVDEDGAVVAAVGFAGALVEPWVVAEPGPLLVAERDARLAAEEAATRLAGLQAVTAALARALDPAEVADAVFVHGLAHLGGNTASLCLLAPGGTMVDIVHEIGYSVDVKEQWQSFPLDAPLPASEAIRTGRLVLLRSQEERDRLYPVFVGTPMVDSHAHAIVPLPDEDGRPFGALVVGFDTPRTFDGGERAMLMSLGSLCAGALRRARLFEATRAAMEAELAARLAAEKAQERLAFMAEASTTLASFLDYELTLSQVVDLAVPRLADWCAVHLVGDDGRIRPLAVAHVDPERVALVRDLHERYPPDPDAAGGIGGVVRTGRPEVTVITDELVEATVADPVQRDLINRVGLGAIAVYPLRARGRVLGALSLATDKGTTFSDDSLSLAQELAVRASVAIDNALLFEDRSRIARRLQASLLPARLPEIPGLEVGARYLAAGEGVQVGGDLYDVFATDAGRWAVVVGDVRGKGVEAAALTGLTRITIRSESIRNPAPSAILAHVNEVLRRTEAGERSEAPVSALDAWERSEPRFCTVALAMVEPAPAGARVTVSVAGHPLPVLVRADGSVTEVGRPGSLLGVGVDLELHDVDVDLGHGDVMVFFTDGIVERHEGRNFFDDDGLVRAVRAVRDLDAPAIAVAIEEGARAFAEGEPRDDMAVVVLKVPDGPRPGNAAVTPVAPVAEGGRG
jgi:serine phosphatase RsbU (regulator of sigma subunit)/PAS domain-containing protein